MRTDQAISPKSWGHMWLQMLVITKCHYSRSYQVGYTLLSRLGTKEAENTKSPMSPEITSLH